jgi:pyruvate dehydrogenase E2 component (dihydrolipoamide acetyltransferase)
MPQMILMPALSPTMEEGTLAKWLVREGDAVRSGQVIAEIETDKATMEFEAADDGVIGRLLVAAGTEGVKVNTPIAELLAEGEAPGAPAAPSAPAPAPAPSAPAAPPAPAADPPSAPEAAPTPAPASARAAAAPAPAAAAAPAAAGGALAPAALPGGAPRAAARLFASPLARRLAAEAGLDLAAIRGSGPHGRIVRADVEAARAGAAASAPAPAAAATAAPPPAPAAAQAPAAADAVLRLYEGRPYEEVKLDGMRRVVAERLTAAKQTIPHFYLRRDIRLDALLALRAELNAALEPRGVKLSVNDFIIRAAALALAEVPDANAVWAGDRILRLRTSDVAVAVAVEGGLFTPVIRDAQTKSIATLSAEMKDLAARARARRLAPHEYQGGSFAISNLGMYGIDSFDAVINPPQAAILAVGAGTRRPVVAPDGSLAAATVMSVTLSVDHRVIDGALGADLLGAIVRLVEAPLSLLA